MDESGAIVAQDDRLGVPAEHWQPGDVFIPLLNLPQTTTTHRLGAYDPLTGQRLTTANGMEYLQINDWQ